MLNSKIKKLPIATCLYLAVAFVVSSRPPNNRFSKHFSLFSVVQFNNEECTTDTTPAGGTTQGTCYTSTECTDKGGVSAGKCASGFGVCCVFLIVNVADTQITENRTRLRNNEFPNTADDVAAVDATYTINKMQPDICQIRLDFDIFVIGGPANIAENIGTAPAQTTNTHCTQDTLTIVSTAVDMAADTNTATLCGRLTGEHLYVELSSTAADTASVQITTAATAVLTPANADRVWDIKVSQIECHSRWRAPQGCDRYLMADAGQITSLNFGFLNAANNEGNNLGIELASQRIKTCIRRSKGMCCVEYKLCTQFGGNTLVDVGSFSANGNMGWGQGAANAATNQFINPAWSLDTNTFPYVIDTDATAVISTAAKIFNANINSGLTDAQCSGDYVEIPSSWSGACGPSHGSARNTINSRYCGARFGANWGMTEGQATHSTPVCDCSEPFVVRHNSDTANDIGGTGLVPAAANIAAGTQAIVLGDTVAMTSDAINTNNEGNARPRGFCLDYRQMPCWN